MLVPIERLKRVKKVICHDSCPDGMASAILVHDVLSAEVVFHQNGTKAARELPAEEGMLFVDFSPPPERALEFARAGVIVLDHHEKAQAIVENLSVMGRDAIGIFANEPGVSGAVLAFRHVWSPLVEDSRRGFSPGTMHKRASDFAHLAGVRDTWQRAAPQWDEACAQAEALLFWPTKTWLMEDSFGSNYDAHRRLVSFGRPLVEKKAEAVKAALRGAWRTTTPKGTRLVVFQGVALSSDAAEALGEEADIVVGFSYEMDGGSHKLRLSTRSHTGYDVGALAKHYGGSGHVAAAGLSVHFEYDDWEVDGAVGMATQHPYAAVRDLILAFEER